MQTYFPAAWSELNVAFLHLEHLCHNPSGTDFLSEVDVVIPSIFRLNQLIFFAAGYWLLAAG
jgi:hypothetical protein